MSKVGSKRGREIEDEEERFTKKLKYDQCNVNVLPEELLMQILVRVTKKNIDTLSEVSSQWRQITRSRNFWKTSCQLKWTTMVVTDTLDFNKAEHLVPTITLNGKTLVDWQFYYKLRTKFGKATRAITKSTSNQEFNSRVSQAVAGIASMGSELQRDTISRFLETIPLLSVNLKISQFAGFVVPVVDLCCDIALLCYVRDEINWCKSTVSLLSILVKSKKPRAKLFSFCKRTFGLCQMVRDKHPDMISSLVLLMILQFKAMTSFDDRSKKLFTVFTEYLIQLGPLDLGKYNENIPDLAFRYPFSVQDPDGLKVLKEVRKIKEFTIPIEVAIRMYHASDDWKVKASAVAVGLRLSNLTQEYIEQYCALAIHAAKQSEQKLAFSGIIGLYGIVRKATEPLMKFIKQEQAVEMFELFTDAFTRYDSTLSLLFYYILLRMLLHAIVQSEWISDELLDRFVTNVLNALAQLNANVNVPQPEDNCVYLSSTIGEVFKSRIANKFDRIKVVYFDLAKNNRFKTTKMLECYVNIGVAVLEDEFAPEFRQLTKQIIDGTSPFKTTALECYGRFANVWLRYVESDVERENIVKTVSIPKEVSEFGQAAMYSESDSHSQMGLVPFPNTLAELLKDYKCAEVPKINILVRHMPPKHHVPKEHLTPVINKAYGQALEPKIRRAHLYASQLLKLVVSDDGKYIKHAQTVLNAMLAAFRLDANRLNLHDSILALLALVQPEMEPTEFVKYIEIVFQTLDNETDDKDMIAKEKQMSDLFSYGLGIAKSSTIERAINVYLFLYNFSTRELLEVDKFVCYCITMWPNTAYGGIHASKLADWLLIQIKQAKSLDQMAPFLQAFASIGVFYGIEFILELFVYDEFAEKSPKEYLDSIMPHFRALYEAGTKGTIAMDALELKYLRNFLILYAMYLVNDLSEDISMLCKVSANDAEVLLSVIASEESIDTGVPELNQFFIGLDLKGLCKELSLTLEDEVEEALK